MVIRCTADKFRPCFHVNLIKYMHIRSKIEFRGRKVYNHIQSQPALYGFVYYWCATSLLLFVYLE